MSVAVGIGFRAGASAEAIERGVHEALTRAGGAAAGLHTSAHKAGAANLVKAAARLGLGLHYHDEAALAAVRAKVRSHSQRIAGLFGVGSLAVAAALAGAGAGARLVVPKFSGDGVSCAVAKGGER